jgi:starch phosphorylase
MGPVQSGIISKRPRLNGNDACAFAGDENALYDRHLAYDIVDPAAIDTRERFEAFARAVRDVLSQRWLKTADAHVRQNPKHVYYLSIEFLIGRSLANNVTNLLLDPIVRYAVKDDDIEWLSLLEKESFMGQSRLDAILGPRPREL